MSTSNFTFRAFTHDGDCRLAAFPSLDGLRMQEHLIPVLDSIIEALADRPPSCKLVLSLEDTEPFQVEWTSIGDMVSVARLTRADTDAVLISVLDASGDLKVAEGGDAAAGVDSVTRDGRAAGASR